MADFVSVASVQIGLICLGGALACLRLHPGETFPHGVITAVALARMVCSASGSCDGSCTPGFVDRNDKVQPFLGSAIR
jgi:hypothetical protein